MEITKTEKKFHVFAVAPHAGAWIEMVRLWANCLDGCVAPHAGAWIEIVPVHKTNNYHWVAPHAGAWIEMAPHMQLKQS